MTELFVLKALVLLSAAIAPLGTRLFGPLPRGWTLAYGFALVALGFALFGPLPQLSWAWALFCLGNALVFARPRLATFRSLPGLASGVPFAFSMVAATWIVGATNDLRILGYGPHFSFYAALHGNVLGWMVVGAIAALASRPRRGQPLYVAVVFLAFASFLLVAFGIDQLAVLKLFGVSGLSLALGLALLVFLAEVRTRSRAAFALGAVAFAGLLFTMVLAWQNELAAPAIGAVLGVRSMVSVHGALNALVVGPALLVAVAIDARS